MQLFCTEHIEKFVAFLITFFNAQNVWNFPPSNAEPIFEKISLYKKKSIESELIIKKNKTTNGFPITYEHINQVKVSKEMKQKHKKKKQLTIKKK